MAEKSANCTLNGLRSRCKDGNGNGPYWFGASGSYGVTATDTSPTWQASMNGQAHVVNPIISSPSGNNKYNIAVKFTTPAFSGKSTKIVVSCNIFRYGSSTGPVYAVIRPTAASDKSDTADTFTADCIGGEQSVSGIVGSESSPKNVSFTFTSDTFKPSTVYYLFLYTRSTSYIYAAYGNYDVCSGALLYYEEAGAFIVCTNTSANTWSNYLPFICTNVSANTWAQYIPWICTNTSANTWTQYGGTI